MGIKKSYVIMRVGQQKSYVCLQGGWVGSKKAQILLLRLSPQRLNMCDDQVPPRKRLSGVYGCHQIDAEADEPHGCVDLGHLIMPSVVLPHYIRHSRVQVKFGVAVRGRSLNPRLGQLQ